MEYNHDIHSLEVTDEETLGDYSSDKNGTVLVFIPDTHGISSRIQLKNLRNDYHKIQDLGFQILVVSSEGKDRLSESSDDLSLPFLVKHDDENVFAKSFNTLGTKFDNPYISERTKRRTYILSKNLDTLHVIDNIHPGFHSEEIINLLTKKMEYGHLGTDYSNNESVYSGK